jgi:hypothetical protein
VGVRRPPEQQGFTVPDFNSRPWSKWLRLSTAAAAAELQPTRPLHRRSPVGPVENKLHLVVVPLGTHNSSSSSNASAMAWNSNTSAAAGMKQKQKQKREQNALRNMANQYATQ